MINEFRNNKDGKESLRFKDTFEKLRMKCSENQSFDTSTISNLVQKIQIQHKYLREVNSKLQTEIAKKESSSNIIQGIVDDMQAQKTHIEDLGKAIEEISAQKCSDMESIRKEKESIEQTRLAIDTTSIELQKINSEIYSFENRCERELADMQENTRHLEREVEKKSTLQKTLRDKLSQLDQTLLKLNEDAKQKEATNGSLEEENKVLEQNLLELKKQCEEMEVQTQEKLKQVEQIKSQIDQEVYVLNDRQLLVGFSRSILSISLAQKDDGRKS